MIYNQLLELFEDYFGLAGPAMLEEVMHNLHIENVEKLQAPAKVGLINYIIEVAFAPICSVRKQEQIRAQLFSILKVPVPKNPEDIPQH